MAKSLKLWLIAFMLVFVSYTNASHNSGSASDDDDSDDDDSPGAPTMSPSQQALNALIRACPCFEELGGDERNALDEVREECLGESSGGSPSGSDDDDDEMGVCYFMTNTAGDQSTLTCTEDVIFLDATAMTCTVTEIGDTEPEETYTLTAAQVAICQSALAGTSDDFDCITPAPTAAPTTEPTTEPTAAPFCQQATSVTNVTFAVADATTGGATAFAQSLIEQAIAPQTGVTVQIDSATAGAGGNLVITYTLCGEEADVTNALANIDANVAAGTVFDVDGVNVSLLSNNLGPTTTTTTTTTAQPLTTQSLTTTAGATSTSSTIVI